MDNGIDGLLNIIQRANNTGEYAIWQYSSTGRVSGISTDVDMNYLIGYPKDHGAASSINIPDETQNIISYSAHVSDIGWMNSVSKV